MPHDDDATLIDIAQAARSIARYLEGLDESAFHGNAITQDAVLYRLTVIGEAVKRLSRAFRDSHPDVPWDRIAAMRNRLVHDYGSVRIDLVWEVATKEVPALLDRLAPELPEEHP